VNCNIVFGLVISVCLTEKRFNLSGLKELNNDDLNVSQGLIFRKIGQTSLLKKYPFFI
jgi:hypothetical protein